jgi:hypothetical protein
MLFKSYPRLAHQLDEINAATLPSMGGENSSTRSQNVRGKRQWNPDQGVDNGLKALQRARNGKDGEGVKEFSAFVIRLVSKGSTVDPDTLQKEKEEEDAQIVSQLLNGDL